MSFLYTRFMVLILFCWIYNPLTTVQATTNTEFTDGVYALEAQTTDRVQAHIDSAIILYRQGLLAEARSELDTALKINQKSAIAHYWTGIIDLQEDQIRKAEQAFKKANRYNKNLPEPYNGLGQAYRRMKNREMDAVQSFKQAIDLDPSYVDAQYNLARAYLEMSLGREFSSRSGNTPLALKALLRTVEIDPNHPSAYHDLGVLHERGLQDVEKAVTYYKKQVQTNPNRMETLQRLGMAYFKTHRYEEGIKTLSPFMRQTTESATTIQAMVAILQAALAYQNQQFERAAALFSDYIRALPTAEQLLYDDITPIASASERQIYSDLSPSDQLDYRRQYWKLKDPDPTTSANERLIEHYRRVVFARINFGEQKFPWDRRGEIYIRYGDPDDRQILEWIESAQSSETGNYFASGATQRQSLDRDLARYTPTGNNRVDAIRERNQPLYSLYFDTSTRRQATYTIESWVYAAMNIELFFINQFNRDIFDYPLPETSSDANQMSREMAYHPANIVRDLVRKVPEVHQHDFGGDPMRFYFDPVVYQGEGSMSEVDLAIAVPMGQLGDATDKKGDKTVFESRIMMTNALWHDVASATQRVGPLIRPQMPQSTEISAGMTTFQMPVSVAPGEYTMGVSVRDDATRKIGIYRQPVEVTSYNSPQLLISGIRLASSIKPTPKQRGPFIRHGLEIVPNPLRTFARNHPVHVYYELYNLQQDENGNTGFQIELTVQPAEESSSLVWRVFSEIGGWLGADSEDQTLMFSMEDASQAATTARYVALDMNDAMPGRYAVEIKAKDLRTDQTAMTTAAFVITEEITESMHNWTTSVTNPEESEAFGVDIEEDNKTVGSEDSDSSRVAWRELLNILQTPQYAVDDSSQANQDASIKKFVINLSENINQAPSAVDVGIDEAYENMIYVPAGLFLMGSEDVTSDEQPMQMATTESFYMDRYEVTNEAYKQFTDATQHSPPRHWTRGAYPPGEAKYPVVGVSWFDAQTYATWAGKRLPTELEWEKAARGENGRQYPWGDVFVAQWLNINGDTDAYKMTAPVGSFTEGASPYGVHDMAGNVWEWTSNWFQPYEGNVTPNAAYGEQYRVIRGGSWINLDTNTRAAKRGRYYPSDTSLNLGFRCVKDPKVSGRLSTAGYGYLYIVTPDTWADIYVDGEKLGQTPRADPLRLRPGQHTLELKNPYYQAYQQTVTVDPNNQETVQAMLKRKETAKQ